MSESDTIQAASHRLALALEALEAAAERRSEADRGATALVTQLHLIDGDRARLASELDEATARSRAMENVNREVAQRIAQAIETIRGVLGSGP